MNSNHLKPLETVTIETNPNINHKKCIIWLHGLGADGHDFTPMIPELKLPQETNYKFIFPHAPLRPVTINNNDVMRAWYDIYSVDINDKIDHLGIDQSIKLVNALIIEAVNQGTKISDIILAGFSQGGVIALTTALQASQDLGGVIALSCYLPRLPQQLNKKNVTTPMFMGHGHSDPVIPIQLGETAKTQLSQAGFNIEWHTYPIEHNVCAEEIADISNWLQNLKP